MRKIDVELYEFGEVMEIVVIAFAVIAKIITVSETTTVVMNNASIATSSIAT
jgi:hypothetical protein